MRCKGDSIQPLEYCVIVFHTVFFLNAVVWIIVFLVVRRVSGRQWTGKRQAVDGLGLCNTFPFLLKLLPSVLINSTRFVSLITPLNVTMLHWMLRCFTHPTNNNALTNCPSSWIIYDTHCCWSPSSLLIYKLIIMQMLHLNAQYTLVVYTIN